MNFKNKKVTVFGLGLNTGGVGTVEFLVRQGVREVVVTDIRKREELAASLAKLSPYKNVTYVLGQHRPEDFTHVDMVVKNPVIPWTNDYVKLARKNGIPVEMDSSIFFALCKRPVIGVTGTKGKTTTASLIAHMLRSAGRNVVEAGIGQVGVLSRLSKITPESVVVFELSSWRLSALEHLKKSPHIAVITNLYPDHLNYYKTIDAYAADKRNIFLFQKKQDTFIANFDNEPSREMAQDAPAQLGWFSKAGKIDGDGVWMEDGMILAQVGGKETVLLPVEKVALPGEHNLSNVLAAAGAVLAYGLSTDEVRAGLSSFVGVPHRLEFVREQDGVRYYNDTAATIPEAAIAALRTFQKPVVLLAGGSDKRLEFAAFTQAIIERVKKVILFKGEGTEKILQELRRLAPEKQGEWIVVDSMAEAVRLAREAAEPGDIVLLSPGTASFGVFQNEFDRGDQFRDRVKELS